MRRRSDTPSQTTVPSDCVVNFDNLHTIRREALRRPILTLSTARMAEACRTLRDAVSC